VGEAQVRGELSGGGLHPPALEEGEKDDHGYGDEDAEDRDGDNVAL
jgi:hypothetical protein